MKKILSLILTLFCVLSLVGCGRSMDDIIKNESSITGVVEEVYNNSILISIQTDAYPYGAYCDVSFLKFPCPVHDCGQGVCVHTVPFPWRGWH